MNFRPHNPDGNLATGTRFADMVELTRQVIAAFDRVQRRPWSVEVAALELSKQVGDLARRILTFERYYLPDRDHHPAYATDKDDVANELADILHWLIRLSLHYGIDLERAHYQARSAELGYAGHALSQLGAVHADPATPGVLNMEPAPTAFPPTCSVSAQSVVTHYDKLLCKYYDWMLGGFDQAADASARLFTELKIIGADGATALDLGAGTGVQSVPLATAGFSVTAVDLSACLLAELEKHAKDLPVQPVQGDMLNPATYAKAAPFDIVVCMGDTLTHLGNEQEVYRLFANVMSVLKSGGPLILSWRDMSGPVSPTGAPQAYPVRLDQDRLFTTVIAEAGPYFVSSTDIITVRGEKDWEFGQDSYYKIRLGQMRCVQMLLACGFWIQTVFKSEPLTYVVARRG
ncbi:methyltransferase domain-containing protein [Bradyrhizobium sp. CB82]|uniref:methyltransferase domain-containing protein n=1 Tax=Bradyrhizobium sp. CB82 TaxID=3039159 RepID=UPI0024B204ED|nr:methyltransferase domain-containing protein [Bradyrhizobium sp. CB82]WFU40956.1 methyltransferase domain-containing protein [Bradyrhizobium sp. CB82]